MDNAIRKGSDNYFIRLGLNFLNEKYTNEFIMERIKEKSVIWMESRKISDEEKENLKETVIPGMKRVMCDVKLRSLEAQNALEFAKTEALDIIATYIEKKKTIPWQTAWQIMKKMGYPYTMFRQVFGVPVIYNEYDSVEYSYRCGNCSEFIGTEKYCPYCGARKGEGDFLPYRSLQQCVYGPLSLRFGYSCNECGNKWGEHAMFSKEYYCPKCGSNNINQIEVKKND